MLSVRKDLGAFTSMNMMGHPEYYVFDDYDFESKIMRAFPDIEWVLNDQGEVIDVNYTVSTPIPKTVPEQIDALIEENQLLTDCILEMSKIIYSDE